MREVRGDREVRGAAARTVTPDPHTYIANIEVVAGGHGERREMREMCEVVVGLLPSQHPNPPPPYR